jgi:hypothetical protein
LFDPGNWHHSFGSLHSDYLQHSCEFYALLIGVLKTIRKEPNGKGFKYNRALLMSAQVFLYFIGLEDITLPVVYSHRVE